MEAIVICIEGLEQIAQLEIKEILKQNSQIIVPSRIKFKVKDEKALAEFIYNSRSIIKLYSLIDYSQFSSLEELLNKLKKIKFSKIKAPFAVKCERTGQHDFNSIDLEKEAGDIINKDGKIKVDLKNPTTVILFDIINDNCLIGIDYTGIRLSKRPYRVKLIPNSLNPCLAYSLIRVADIKDKEIILDPFCRSGEIIIEAAMFLQKIPVNSKNLNNLAFTKLIKYKPKEKIKNMKLKLYAIDSLQNNLRNTEINAKIAGINKSITFSRYDIEWLDTKFNKHSIDKIVTFPHYPTNTLPKDRVEKIYKELFYQAEFILKNNGTITILTPCPDLIEKYAMINKFKKHKEIKINYMHQPFYILLFKK